MTHHPASRRPHLATRARTNRGRYLRAPVRALAHVTAVDAERAVDAACDSARIVNAISSSSTTTMHPRATSYAPAHGAGLTSRPNAQTNAPGEFAMDMPTTSSGFDLEDDVASLRSKVKQLKSMSRRIGEEATIRGDLIDALTIDFSSGDAAMRDVRRKLGAVHERAKGGHLMSLMFFAVLAFLGMFFFVKFNKAIRFLVPRGTGQSVRHH